MSNGLVLTGGGARGAYQAGVLRAVAEIQGPGPMPFRVVAGTSAGSINAVYLAGRAEDFQAATTGLWKVWADIRPDSVFRTDAGALTKIGASWLTDLGLGAWMGSGHGRSLLDTAPLRATLEGVLDVEAARRNVTRGVLTGLAVSATRYDTGLGVTFYDANPKVDPWHRRTRAAEPARVGLDHVLASSAIPIFFPATRVDGVWYGDGGVRMQSPLSPAIHLGARRILAIGVQKAAGRPARGGSAYPSKAETAGLLLDALFMDALDADVERCERINRTLALLPDRGFSKESPLHPVATLAFQPTRDLGTIGTHTLDSFPYVLRHLLRGLGANDAEGWELVSYLAFDGLYTRELLDAGYADGMQRRAEIEAFLAGGDPAPDDAREALRW